MDRTITAIFDDRAQGEKAVDELRREGFEDEISIISKGRSGKENRNYGGTQDDISDGAVTGGTVGALGGLLASAGALAIPGIGPILALGPLAATLSGAVVGGLAGGLIDYGIPEERGRHLEERVKQGDTLVIVECPEEKSSIVSQTLKNHGAHDVETHKAR